MKICIGSVEFGHSGGNQNSFSLYSKFFQKNNFLEVISLRSLFHDSNNFDQFSIPIHSPKSLYPFIYPNYYIWPRMVKKYLNDFDVYQQIGGSFLGAEPFYFYKKPYYLWLGTTYTDEWTHLSNEKSQLTFGQKLFRKYIAMSINKVISIEKRIYNGALKIFSQSNHTKLDLIKHYDVNIDKIELIPCPLKSDILKAAIEQKSSIEEEQYLVTVSRLDPRKNLKAMIDIFGLLKKRPGQENLHLKIIGNGEQKYDLLNYIHVNNLDSEISILSNLNDLEVYSCVKNALIYLSTSLQEGFGISILEAMYLRRPVIIYDNGGSRDYIKDKMNGYLINPNESHKFVDQLELLLNDEAMQLNLGEKAFESAKEYEYEKIFEKMNNFYNN
jgi:glycosyltransferase involved in cell wall biosynthesis